MWPAALAARRQRARARVLDGVRIVAVEHIDAAGEAAEVGGGDAVHQEEDRRPVRIFRLMGQSNRLRRGVAVARRAMRQKARLVIGPQQRRSGARPRSADPAWRRNNDAVPCPSRARSSRRGNARSSGVGSR